MIRGRPQDWIEKKGLELRKLARAGPTDRLDIFKLAAALSAEIIQLSWGGDFPDAILQRLTEIDPECFSAGTLVLPDGFLIVVNPAHSAARNSMSVLEECAHIHLKHRPERIHNLDSHFFSRRYDESMEKEAYAVGAAALLPSSILDPIKSGSISVRNLALHYGVSEDLVRFRLRELGWAKPVSRKARR